MSDKLTRQERRKIIKEETKKYIRESYDKGKKFSDIREDKLPKSGVLIRNSVPHYFNNVVELCKELSIPEEEFVSRNALTRHYASLITKEEVDRFIIESHKGREIGLYAKELQGDREGNVKTAAARRIYGSWEMALFRNGIRPPRVIDKRIIKELKEPIVIMYRECLSISEVSRRTGVSWGVVKNVLDEKGLDLVDRSGWFMNEKPPLSKEETDRFLKEIIADSVNTRYTSAMMEERYPHEVFSIRKHYGNISSGVMNSGEYVIDKQVPRRWSKEILREQVTKGIKLGKRLNSQYLQEGAGTSALTFARDAFGSWENTIKCFGFNYDEITMITQGNADLGKRFESVLDDILKDLGVDYKKEHHEIYKPDYVIGYEWVDAKLSEYTHKSKDRNGLTTIDKYEPHCDRLTIVFLLGNEGTDRMITEKTRLISVYRIIDDMEGDMRAYYKRRLDEIKSIVDGRRGAIA